MIPQFTVRINTSCFKTERIRRYAENSKYMINFIHQAVDKYNETNT